MNFVKKWLLLTVVRCKRCNRQTLCLCSTNILPGLKLKSYTMQTVNDCAVQKFKTTQTVHRHERLTPRVVTAALPERWLGATCFVYVRHWRNCGRLYDHGSSSEQTSRGQSNLAKAALNPPPHRCGGNQDTHLTQCPVGPQECSPHTASLSVQPFLHSEAELSRQTDTALISNNSLHLMHWMQPKNDTEIHNRCILYEVMSEKDYHWRVKKITP